MPIYKLILLTLNLVYYEDVIYDFFCRPRDALHHLDRSVCYAGSCFGSIARSYCSRYPQTLLFGESSVVGDTVIFDGELTGVPMPILSVYFNDMEIDFEQSKYELMFDRGYFRFVIYDIVLEDEGIYIVNATNDSGCAIVTLTLTVTEPKE